MAEEHGIRVREASTVISNSSAAPTLPVVYGTAPINLTTLSAAPINEPLLITSYQDAVNAFGYSDDWDNFTLSEFIYSHFTLYKLGPVVLINILDPDVHKANVAPADVTVTGGVAVVQVEGIIKASVVVKSQDSVTTYVLNTDYTLSYNSVGQLVVTRKSAGAIPSNATALKIGYDKLNGNAVTAEDLIGGQDAITGAATGLELLNQVFPRFGLVPGLLLAPGFSHDPVVAAVMSAKAESINGHFRCTVLIDIPVEDIDAYTDSTTWKAESGITYSNQIACYPNLTKGGKVFHFSTQLAGAICTTDAANGDIPFVSPSNKSLQADGAVQKGGLPLFLGPDQAGFLNAQGIVTAINFGGSWKAWGNRTGAFPGTSDPKDAFIPGRRMFDWISNMIVLTYWSEVDDPLNRKLIETVTDDLNIRLNGLNSIGALLGGRVEFLASENPLEDLMNGKFKFHLYATPPSPGQAMDFVIEYDANYLSGIFGS
jgi:phage tail sheath protein FI